MAAMYPQRPLDMAQRSRPVGGVVQSPPGNPSAPPASIKGPFTPQSPYGNIMPMYGTTMPTPGEPPYPIDRFGYGGGGSGIRWYGTQEDPVGSYGGAARWNPTDDNQYPNIGPVGFDDRVGGGGGFPTGPRGRYGYGGGSAGGGMPTEPGGKYGTTMPTPGEPPNLYGVRDQMYRLRPGDFNLPMPPGSNGNVGGMAVDDPGGGAPGGFPARPPGKYNSGGGGAGGGMPTGPQGGGGNGYIGGPGSDYFGAAVPGGSGTLPGPDTRFGPDPGFTAGSHHLADQMLRDMQAGLGGKYGTTMPTPGEPPYPTGAYGPVATLPLRVDNRGFPIGSGGGGYGYDGVGGGMPTGPGGKYGPGVVGGVPLGKYEIPTHPSGEPYPIGAYGSAFQGNIFAPIGVPTNPPAFGGGGGAFRENPSAFGGGGRQPRRRAAPGGGGGRRPARVR